MNLRQRFSPAARRIGLALTVAAIMVVFSEKVYWYVTGYGVVDLIVGYFFPTYLLLWLIDAFRVRRIGPLFLAAAVFGFLTEGVLVGTLYEGGPLGWFNASYTPLAWHAPLSVVFGYWWLGRRLAAGSLRLVAGCAAVGLLWGLWALAWWLPENAADPALLAQGARLGQWPVADFALHAFAFTGLLAVAHWLLGRADPDLRGFGKPLRSELALVFGGLLFFFIGVLAAVPWAPLKLLPLLGLALGGLWLSRRREPDLSDLRGFPKPLRSGTRPAALLALFVMPAAAVGVYSVAAAVGPSPDVIYAVTAVGLMMGPAVLGWVAFVVALVDAVRNQDFS